MKNQLPQRDKVFWKNFLYALLVFLIAVVIFTVENNATGDTPTPLRFSDFTSTLGLVGFFAIIACCYFIAMKFVRSRKIEEFMEKKGMDNQTFRERYGEFLDYID